ncbi:MAG: lactate dehydrogenase [Alphaproteobacteria bacterium]|nr:lactate dehydrogenase [Alphaproteobacteria bacterium]
MNAVEIEEAITALSEEPFDPAEFPFKFLEAFGNKPATIKKLRSGDSNRSDIENCVLQRSNIHIAICREGDVASTLAALKDSPATTRAKAKFILATDGIDLAAEDLVNDDQVACNYADFPNHFGFFLPLAGITTVKQVRESSFDIRATSRLNKLYVELLKDNPDWAHSERRRDMNHFMSRLIFCFFAEDTGIFLGEDLFTSTISTMSSSASSNTHEVIGELFRAMNTKPADRDVAKIARWANGFPYVNGGLFSGSTESPRFSRSARTYLLHIGRLDWQKINPDIFGSMIQAVADDEERGALGMHYTSVPNILKVLNPLFLDNLREKLEEAGDNGRKLLNLRNRMAKIRVFDPACGSGNFLVIAYKEMRAIEAEINKRRIEEDRRSEIPLTNFRGIELRDFPAEIARLALVIAEYQCDVLYRGQKEALAELLPLNAMNWITCGNALRLDWLSICPPTGTGVKHHADDLFHSPLDQAQIDFENEGGETYMCGNPPYAGLSSQTDEQKADLKALFEDRSKYWKSFDYVMGWFWKAFMYMQQQPSKAAFVSTNSICQGQLVPMFWPLVLTKDTSIFFAHESFRWSNLATNNAGVTVAVIGLSNISVGKKRLFEITASGETTEKEVENINAYLVPTKDIFVEALSKPSADRPLMIYGNKPTDGGNLIMSTDEARKILNHHPDAQKFLRPYFGSEDFINASPRTCVWVGDSEKEAASKVPQLKRRFESVSNFRASSKAKETRVAASYGHRFRQIQGKPGNKSIIIPRHSSETRSYLPVGLLPKGAIVSDAAFAIYDAPSWSLAILLSNLHLVWVAAVCGKLETRYRYSNTLGWNTFPISKLTEKNKEDLARCAEDILLAREAHFPATIAELYEPDKMPANLRAAHDRNDEVLERIYIGRRFKNDTERLEKLFELYTKMTTDAASAGKTKREAS